MDEIDALLEIKECKLCKGSKPTVQYSDACKMFYVKCNLCERQSPGEVRKTWAVENWNVFN